MSLTIDNSAGLLPIEFTEVTITRTLFRSSGESEYAINGVPCRLLDIQELLSDTGVGRQQHVIVSQGQLDAVLNARPEDRRLIIEEAAGVLKYRRRKEKAERRLDATEGNLLRLQDLLREVRRQLRPLERQADAARRHGDLVAELRGAAAAPRRPRARRAAGARASAARTAPGGARRASRADAEGDARPPRRRRGWPPRPRCRPPVAPSSPTRSARLEALRERAAGWPRCWPSGAARSSASAPRHGRPSRGRRARGRGGAR